MNFWQRLFPFKKEVIEASPSSEVKTDYVVGDLQEGYMLDYSMSQWKVVRVQTLSTGDFEQKEFCVKNLDPKSVLDPKELMFISPVDDDEWAVTQCHPIMKVLPELKKHMDEHREPPEKIEYCGVTYMLEEKSLASYDSEPSESNSFNYFYLINEDDDKFIRLEDWGDEEDGDYVLYLGDWVSQALFHNVVPKEWLEGSI